MSVYCDMYVYRYDRHLFNFSDEIIRNLQSWIYSKSSTGGGGGKVDGR